MKYYDYILQTEVTVRLSSHEDENHFYVIKKLSGNRSELVQLQPFYEFSVKSDFTVDSAVLYPTEISKDSLNQSKKKFLFLNEFPKMRIDPLKPLRIANLLGWHILNPNDLFSYQKDLNRE
ncbi:MAG: hypothetical protein IPJ75_15920 [Ignavibacteriales bacterium]|nr:hypothetical protein [Ignavibacteriales bacterium]